MQNKFGLKDFVTLVMLLLIGVSLWLAMFQRNREWDQVQQLRTKTADIERQLSRIESKIEQGVRVSGPIGAGGSGQAAARDESWARPGVPIEWQEPWSFPSDPTGEPDYAPGGEFTEIFEVQPPKLTPFIASDTYSIRITDLVTETLAAYDPQTLRMRGVLAEAWQYDPAGMWLRVKIRDTARFSDGQPVTAEDVRWTFHEYIMNKQIEAEASRSVMDAIKGVTVVSDKVLEFEYTEALFSNKSQALTLINVLPKHFYSQFEAAELNQSTGLLMGSGPYKMERLSKTDQWAPPAPAVLVRNEQYWGTKTPLERIRFKAIDQELARLTEYKNGLADMVTPSAPQFVSMENDPEWLKTNYNLKWVNMRSGRSGIIWNCGPRNGKLTPFHDKRVRQAMTLLLDREKMVKDIWKGVGQVAVGFMNPGTLGADPDLKPWPLDRPRAMTLLKEAGWEDRDKDGELEDPDGNPFVFELTSFGGGEIAERLTTFVKDAYAAAGIRVNVRTMDWSVGEPVRQRRDFDALLQGWGANVPESDPRQIFHSSSIENQGDNYGQWNSPAADRALDAARRELDETKRAALWHEFDRVMWEEQPYTWVRVAPYVRFVKRDFKNVHTYPKGLEIWEFYKPGATRATAGM